MQTRRNSQKIFSQCFFHSFKTFQNKIVLKTLMAMTALVLSGCGGKRVGFESSSSSFSSIATPEILIEKGLEFTSHRLVNLEISSDDAVKMYVTNDPSCLTGGEWESFKTEKSGWSLKEANQATHVYVILKNANDQISECVSDSITHDDQAPKLSWVNAMAARTRETQANFSFKVTDESGLAATSCSVDGQAFIDCEDSILINSLSAGQHQIAVRATDIAGNTSELLQSEWFVDLKAPQVSISQAPTSPTKQTSAAFSFSGSDADAGQIKQYYCQLNQGGFEACSSSKTYTGLIDGNHVFRVIGLDEVGHVSAPAIHSWVIDTQKPKVEIVAKPTNPANTKTAQFTFNASDVNGSGIATTYCRVDGMAYANCSSPQNYANLNEGNHTFYLYAVDRAGNVSDVASYSWMVDTVAPVITFTRKPEATTRETSAMFEYSVIENGSSVASYSCWLDNVLRNCGQLGASSLTDLAVGPHTFRVMVADNAGNSGVATYTWEVLEMIQCYDQRVMQPAAQVTKKLDILFAVDTSSSFNEEKGQVIDEMNSMIANLPSGTDYRVAVVLGHGDNSSYSGALYRRNGESRVLDSQTLSLSSIQASLRDRLINAAGDNETDGGEAVLYSLSKLLKGTYLQTAKTQGFFRSDAALAVIFLSDENDICARPPAGVNLPVDTNGNEGPAYNKYCVNPEVSEQTVYSQLTQLQGQNPLLVSAIVYTNKNTVPSGGENSLGYGFFDIVAANEGLLIDLASGSYAAGLAGIGQLTAERLSLIKRIALNYNNVDASSIMVKIDGTVSTDFTYNAMTNEINLGYAGQALSVIDVHYCQAN